MGYDALMDGNIRVETTSSARVRYASEHRSASGSASAGGDWLTNVDAPAGLEANPNLASLFNWHHVRAGLPSSSPVASSQQKKPLASILAPISAPAPAPAITSDSATALASYPPVSEALNFMSRSVAPNNDDLLSHPGDLPSDGTNRVNLLASNTNQVDQTASSEGAMLPFAHHPDDFPSRNVNNTKLYASVPNHLCQTSSSNRAALPQTHRFRDLCSRRTGDWTVSSSNSIEPRPTTCSYSNTAIQAQPAHAHFQLPPAPLTSPSRQRSLNDLTLPASMPPPVIVRPKSIPVGGAPRLIPPGLVPLNPLTDFQNGLHLQKVTNPPQLYSDINTNSSNDKTLRRHATHPPTEPRFIPMLSITRPDRTGRDLTPLSQQSPYALSSLKFSPRYHGMHTENNASMEHLPPDQNCALWLTNLPPDIRERELLSYIRNMGRIYATYINYPDGHAHATSAAKLVFFTPEGAQKLLAYCTLVKPMVVRGHRVKIALNRIKYAKNSMENGESRVLIITGQSVFVNETSLTAYFEARFQFQLDDVATLITHKDRAVVEYKFGSYRCQAQMGMKALLLERPAGLEMVEYGADPCEVGSEVTSFTVAGERIQGRGLLGGVGVR